MMSNYAPQYSTRERWQLFLCYGVPLIAFAAVLEWWFFPWLKHTSFFLCHPYGYPILLYGLFSGSLLLMASMALLWFGKTFYQVILLRQYPLPQQKVFQRNMPYQYGTWAVLRGIVFFAVVVVCLGMAVWGGYTVRTELLTDANLAKLAQQRAAECPPQ